MPSAPQAPITLSCESIRKLTPRGCRLFQLLVSNVAHRKLSTRKEADSRRHFSEDLKTETLVFENSLRKEFFNIEELCQCGEIDEVPGFCTAEYCQDLIDRQFPAGKHQRMSTLMWREKPEINPEIDLGFLPEALHVKSHKSFVLLNYLSL